MVTIYILGVSLTIILASAIFSFIIKRVVKKSIVNEFEEELNNRIRMKVFLEPADDELVELALNANKSEADADLFNARINHIREEERTKMLKEENFGLKS